jgi:hypothetical protein
MSVVMKTVVRGPEGPERGRAGAQEAAVFDNVEVVVDLQTGAISVVLPPNEQGDRIELETVTAEDMFAPKE